MSYVTGKFREAKFETIKLLTGESINRVENESGLFSFNEKSGIEFDSDREDYPLELDIAITAWRAVAKSGQGEGNTPRQRLEDWLKRNYKNLDNEQVKRIAIVCNWDKGRGRKNNKE